MLYILTSKEGIYYLYPTNFTDVVGGVGFHFVTTRSVKVAVTTLRVCMCGSNHVFFSLIRVGGELNIGSVEVLQECVTDVKRVHCFSTQVYRYLIILL